MSAAVIVSAIAWLVMIVPAAALCYLMAVRSN